MMSLGIADNAATRPRATYSATLQQHSQRMAQETDRRLPLVESASTV